jgi:hypothetical protein
MTADNLPIKVDPFDRVKPCYEGEIKKDDSPSTLRKPPPLRWDVEGLTRFK